MGESCDDRRVRRTSGRRDRLTQSTRPRPSPPTDGGLSSHTRAPGQTGTTVGQPRRDEAGRDDQDEGREEEDDEQGQRLAAALVRPTLTARRPDWPATVRDVTHQANPEGFRRFRCLPSGFPRSCCLPGPRRQQKWRNPPRFSRFRCRMKQPKPSNLDVYPLLLPEGTGGLVRLLSVVAR